MANFSCIFFVGFVHELHNFGLDWSLNHLWTQFRFNSDSTVFYWVTSNFIVIKSCLTNRYNSDSTGRIFNFLSTYSTADQEKHPPLFLEKECWVKNHWCIRPLMRWNPLHLLNLQLTLKLTHLSWKGSC